MSSNRLVGNDADTCALREMSRILHVEYSDEQIDVLKHHGGMCILACAGSGKALANGTGILTPNGYRPIESLRVGDACYSEDGEVQTVLGVFPQGEKRVYRVIFSDGSEIRCCRDHLWTYKVCGSSSMVTNTLGYILDNLPIRIKSPDGSDMFNLSIPKTSSIKFTAKKVLENTYTLGEYIGYKIMQGKADSVESIDNLYKYNSVEVRESLLAGILDIAGTSDNGVYTISSMCDKLANDIKFLAETLGMVVKGGNSALTLYPSGERYIADIVETDDYEPMTCISVSGASKLYVTENCIATHNTTVLTHLIAKRIWDREIPNPNTLLCTTFSKGGATEMDIRLKKILEQIGIKANISVKTLHSVYYRLLSDLGYSVNIIDAGTRSRFIREACKESGVNLQDEDLITMDSIFGYQVNNLLGDKDIYRSYVFTLRNDVSLDRYTAIRQNFMTKKKVSGLMDFDDLQLSVYGIFSNKEYGDSVREYCRSLWTHIYVDEAQDVSRIQFEILKHIVSNPDNLVFIGDDDQCIYQWRGADPSIITNVCGIYTDMTQFKLTTNYRCYGDIVRKAAVGIKFNVARNDKTMKPFKEGGKINVCDTHGGDIYSMSKYAHKYIRDLVLEEGVTPSDIAVLSRNNSHLSVLSSMLFNDGIYCDASESMRFTDNTLYRHLSKLTALANNTINGNIAGDLYWMCCPYMAKRYSKLLGEVQSACGVSVKEVLAYALVRLGQANIDSVPDYKDLNIPIKAYSQLMVFWDKLSFEGKRGLDELYNLIAFETPENAYIGIINLYASSKRYMYKSSERERYLVGYVKYLSDLVTEKGMDNFMRYLRLSEQFEQGKMATISSRISLSTMHGAKGREWKYVVLFADDNVSFPSFDRIQQSLVEGVPESDIRRMLDEDRRLHYVAMTRAKETLTIFSDSKNPGLYTLEALGVMDYEKANNSHIIAMAQHGLYGALVEDARNVIFNENSPYYIDINLGKPGVGEGDKVEG